MVWALTKSLVLFCTLIVARPQRLHHTMSVCMYWKPHVPNEQKTTISLCLVFPLLKFHCNSDSIANVSTFFYVHFYWMELRRRKTMRNKCYEKKIKRTRSSTVYKVTERGKRREIYRQYCGIVDQRQNSCLYVLPKLYYNYNYSVVRPLNCQYHS